MNIRSDNIPGVADGQSAVGPVPGAEGPVALRRRSGELVTNAATIGLFRTVRQVEEVVNVRSQLRLPQEEDQPEPAIGDASLVLADQIRQPAQGAAELLQMSYDRAEWSRRIDLVLTL